MFIMDTEVHPPNQPKNYPFREFGKAKIVGRSFQKQWYEMFSWLDYDENKDVVFCHICCMAEKNQLLNVHSKDLLLYKLGFQTGRMP